MKPNIIYLSVVTNDKKILYCTSNYFILLFNTK